jgi:hypothetical protein
MEPETIRHLLEQKISYINAIGNVSMLWWVTSVVFCVSILATVWKNREDLAEQKLAVWLVGIAGSGLFLGIILYGFSVILYLNSTEREISELAISLNAKADFFSTEIWLFRRAMLIGTSSFAGVLILWIIMFGVLLFMKQKSSSSNDVKTTLEASSSSEPTQHAQPNKSFEPTAS